MCVAFRSAKEAQFCGTKDDFAVSVLSVHPTERRAILR
jgi:hypothetical protein